jgi:phenylalanyl-tRNA synthetase beta chain
MKASVKWLREFVAFSLPPSELANALTMAGLEVENIEHEKNDAILEISVTPNRPDCLSIIGIAREIAAIFKLDFTHRAASVPREEGPGPPIEIQNSALCPRYASRIIYSVQVQPSPEWIRERLESHGVRPVNNIVDITNYVLLEMGHPLHAFDLEKISGNRIAVKIAGTQNTFVTLDSEKRTLKRDMLMIWDAEKPVAIAGVMGGLHTEVTDSTKNILLESAQFSPQSIRRTSRAFVLNTEASYRFERGTDINNVTAALDRVAHLIVENAGGKITRMTDIHPTPFKPQPLTVPLKKIYAVIGTELETSQIQGILTRIGIKNTIKGEGIAVTSPSFRQDLQMDVDIIEEIARLYGYNNIPSTLPKIALQSLTENKRWVLTKKVKETMVRSGYAEAINYSFINTLDLDRLNIPTEDTRRKLIKIRNPLKKEDESLRTTLIPALLENARLNISRGEKSLRLFELAGVFFATGKRLPEEVLTLSALHLKNGKTSFWQEKHDSFYDLKGVLENLLKEFRIKDYSFTANSTSHEPYLHPGKSSLIKAHDKTVGSLGTLHPEVAEAFEVAHDVIIFEINLEAFFAMIPSDITFRPLPRYPYIERDIAIIVDEDVSVHNAEKVLSKVKAEIVESYELFDIYTGKPIPQGKKSLAFSIRYRAGDRTLTDEEVNVVHSHIIDRLINTLKAKLRT